MSECVLDCSVALAWALPDERSRQAVCATATSGIKWPNGQSNQPGISGSVRCHLDLVRFRRFQDVIAIQRRQDSWLW